MAEILTPPGFAITDVGIAAVSTADPAGPKIEIVEFRLGDNATTPPSINDVGLAGNVVYTGTPASLSLYDSQTIQVNMEVPANAGPFNYGELGLYLPNGILFARYSYGAMQPKVVAPNGAGANVLRISALLRVSQGLANFIINTGTQQSVLEVNDLSLVNTPTVYPENPILLVHEPNDFQESILLYRNQDTLWNIANYQRIGTAQITSAPTVFSLEAAFFGNLYLPPNNRGRYVLQFPGGYLRTVVGINGGVVTIPQQMDTAAYVGQNVAVYQLDSASFSDMYAEVQAVVTAMANYKLYLGQATLAGVAYTASPSTTTLPEVFSVTFAAANPANPTLKVGNKGPYPLVDVDGNPVPEGLISAGETDTVVFAGNKFILQYPLIPVKTSQLLNDSGYLTTLTAGDNMSISGAGVTRQIAFSGLQVDSADFVGNGTPGSPLSLKYPVPHNLSELTNDVGYHSGVLSIAQGGTGQTTAGLALKALLPDQTGQDGKVLMTQGGTSVWGFYLPQLSFSQIQNKPTTISGYGITDAQPLDADLTALAALASTGFVRRDGNGQWSVSTTPYDLSNFVNGKPQASEVLMRIVAVRSFKLPAALAGSVAYATYPAQVTKTLSVQKNGATVGTITFGAGNSAATFTMAAEVTFQPGDQPTVAAPTIQDTTLSDIAITLMAIQL